MRDQYTTTFEIAMLFKMGYLFENVKASRIGDFCVCSCKLLILNGGQRRDRTADAGLFRAGVATRRSDG
jgi:hypothetical protein